MLGGAVLLTSIDRPVNIQSTDRLRLSQRLAAAESCDEITNLLVGAFSPFGYTRFVYGLSLDERPTVSDYVILTNLSDEWMAFYRSERFYERDYPLDFLKSETTPLRWITIDDRLATEPDGEKYASAWRIVQDWGINSGVTIPLPFVGRYKGGISLVGPPHSDAEAQDKRYLANEAEILSLVYLFHSSVNKSVIARTHFGLSNREIDVLQRLSEGRQTKHIAAEFDTSPHTVEKQIKSARTRLGAQTTAEAVTHAALLGMVR